MYLKHCYDHNSEEKHTETKSINKHTISNETQSMSSMNILEVSHADSKHNSLHKREFIGKRLNKVEYHSRVKAGCKPVRTNPGPYWRKLKLVFVGIWPDNTPWEPAL